MLRTYITVRAVFWILQGIVLLIMLAGAFVAHGQVVTGDLLDVRHGQIVRDAVNRPAAVLDVLNALSARPSQPSATLYHGRHPHPAPAVVLRRILVARLSPSPL